MATTTTLLELRRLQDSFRDQNSNSHAKPLVIRNVSTRFYPSRVPGPHAPAAGCAAGRATRPPSPTRLARAPPPARAASAVGGLRSRATHGTRPDELDPSKGKDRKQRKLESHPGRLMLRPVVGRGSCRNSGPGGVWRRSTVQSRLSRAIGNPDRVSRPCSWPAWAARTAWRAARHRAPPRGPGVLARVSPRR